MREGRIVGSAPILLVADVVAAANYYRDKLGFTYERFWGNPPNFCMVHRDGLKIRRIGWWIRKGCAGFLDRMADSVCRGGSLPVNHPTARASAEPPTC